ncbi:MULTISPECIES: hypothetical protein [Bradyrhizobium]|nr:MULTISPECIES: hypothetical protein [Bradyrhizobium]
MTEAERQEWQRQTAFDEMLKEMENAINVLLVNVQVLRRNGPSKDLLRRIDESGSRFTELLQAYIAEAKATPPRLTAKGR